MFHDVIFAELNQSFVYLNIIYKHNGVYILFIEIL